MALTQGDSHRVDFAAVFAMAGSLAEAVEVVTDSLARKMASTLSLTRKDIDLATPMHGYGVDSLVAVELSNWFANELRADVPYLTCSEARRYPQQVC